MLNLFNQGWVGSLIGTLGLLVGVIGLILYVRSKIGPRPACQMKSTRLIGKEEQGLPPEVRILYQDTDVPRLTLTKIWLWNCGTETIRGNQVVEDDPLRCSFDKDDHILALHVAAVTRRVNKFDATIHAGHDNEALMTFDFLDPNDGARVEVLHTSGRKYPEVLGTIRGVPKGIRQLTTTSSNPFDRALLSLSRQRGMFVIAALIAGLASLTFGILLGPWLAGLRDVLKDGDRLALANGFRVVILAAGALYTVMSLSMMISWRRKHPSALDSDIDREKVDATAGAPASPMEK